MSATIQIGRDEATKDVAAVHAKLATPAQRKELMGWIGKRAETEMKAWFVRRDRESPNKMGWPQKHFWLRKEMQPNFDPSKTTETSATLAITDPAFAAKMEGATIRPKPPHQALAIPMNAEAYAAGSPGNKENSRIPGMFVLRAKATNGAYLVRKDGPDTKTANLTFFYRLVPEVTVPKDPQALPPREQLGAALSETAREFILEDGSKP